MFFCGTRDPETHAISNNWFCTFSGLTADSVHWHLPKSLQTTMGHMHKVRQNIHTRKIEIPNEIMDKNRDIKDLSEEYLPPRKIQNREHIVQVSVVKF